MKINDNKIKKFSLLAAILAPMIYLFGSLFATLQGAHGQQVFAEPVYTSEYVEVDSFDGVDDYKIVVDSPNSWALNLFTLVPNVEDRLLVSCNFDFQGSSFTSVRVIHLSGDYWIEIRTDSSTIDLLKYEIGSGSFGWRKPQPFIFYTSDVRFATFVTSDCSVFKSVLVPTDVVPVNDSAYSDYLFKNFFVKNNFLSGSGEKVINGTPDYGFAPAADMIRFVDGNMFHLANVEWGYLVIGYTYYAFHVVCVFLVFNLLMFFPHLIENIYEKFERGW